MRLRVSEADSNLLGRLDNLAIGVNKLLLVADLGQINVNDTLPTKRRHLAELILSHQVSSSKQFDN